MLFNSIDFAIYLPIVFLLYWFVFQRNIRVQNFFIVVASYVFYGWWDWRFLSLLMFSTVVDYSVGIALSRTDDSRRRKMIFLASIVVNLGFLGFFKYYNFFADNFVAAFSFFGMKFHASTLKIVLPVGISFYTFQTLSYSIDVYRRKLEPTRDFVAFTAFVSFFPQLVAGPIERATNLLPQFFTQRQFDYLKARDGMRQILWGLFKKMVIADNCAQFANEAFGHYTHMSGSSLALGVFFFSIQIYCDFSGYSDIAIGTARLFGFSLMRNFSYPYFSRDIAEFWRRWHISLTTWFRDYLYIPLGGSRGNTWLRVRNTFIIFLVSGFWHGANWTFIAWGALNAIYFLPLLLTHSNRKNLDVIARGRSLPGIAEFMQMVITFLLTDLAWIFFRAETIGQAFAYIHHIFSASFFTLPHFSDMSRANLTLVLTGLMLLMEWMGREQEYAIEILGLRWNRPLRWAMYALIIFCIGMFTPTHQTPFIYFQF